MDPLSEYTDDDIWKALEQVQSQLNFSPRYHKTTILFQSFTNVVTEVFPDVSIRQLRYSPSGVSSVGSHEARRS